MPTRLHLDPGTGGSRHPNRTERTQRRTNRALEVNHAYTNNSNRHDDLSDEEEYPDAQSDRLSQKSRRSNSSSRSSSRSRSSHPTKKPRSSRRDASSDDESVLSDQGVPDSFRSNKENQRQFNNSAIMGATTRQNKKAGKKGRRNDSAAQDTECTPEEARRLEDSEAEVKKLRDALALAKASVARPTAKTSRAKMTPEERRWAQSVSDSNKRYNWGMVKFCQSDDKLVKLTANVFERWDLKEFESLVGDTREAAKVQWITQNKELVRAGMNDARNYAQAGLRKLIVNRLIAKQWVPTPEQVYNCALRTEEYHTNAEYHKIFDFYADVLLFKVVGKPHWDTWIRYYKTISSAKPASDPQPGACITVGTEAFLVALYENCFDKWQMLAEMAAKGEEDPKRLDPRNKTKCIDQDGGQAKWGGWNKYGRDMCKKYGKEIKEARDQPHVKEMEEAGLQRLRVANDIEAKDKKRGSRKRKVKETAEGEESENEFDNF